MDPGGFGIPISMRQMNGGLFNHSVHLSRCTKLLRLTLWPHKDVVDRDHGRSSEMDEHRVPNLEEMDEQQAHRFLMELFSNLSAKEEYELRHQDYVMEMPQSGECIRGREKMREFQEAYPTTPSIRLRWVLVRDGLWVVEGVNDYGGGQVFEVVLIIELRDGKMWRDRRYYAEPFEAPEWRGGRGGGGGAERVGGGPAVGEVFFFLHPLG